MTAFKFSDARAEDHVEKIGFDVRPVIEIRMERQRLFTFGESLIDKYPQLFESQTIGATEFQVRKKLVFPGKGQVEFTTLVLTVRGPVFVIPRRIAAIEEETDFGDANEIVRECLRGFMKCFPDRRVIRAGKVNEFIFGCDDIAGNSIICEHFLSTKPDSGCSNVDLRLNFPTEEHNRSIRLFSVQGERQHAMPEGVTKTLVNGVGVHVDFNNRDVSKPLEIEEISSTLRKSDEFIKNGLYPLLNREEF